MKNSYFNLDKVLNSQNWQKLQDSLAMVTKMAIITVDYKGIPITTHSCRQPFCTHVRNDPKLEPFCHKCDSRGGLEAARINAPYIYQCHCNIVDLAVPILIDGKYVGAIMAGQIRLAELESAHGEALEQILISPAKNLFETEELKRLYAELPVLPYREILQVADMLFDLCSYIVEEAMSKNLILETYERMASSSAPVLPGIASGYTLDTIKQVRKAMTHVITNAHLQNQSERFVAKNPVLQPVFDYIGEHKGETTTQKQMADLCHISASHFSRLFSRETGEGFSNYLARVKVEWAKQILEETDLTVTQVSDELGFSDPGYFIKTFKKYENVTPATYRKYYREGHTFGGAKPAAGAF